MGILTDLLGFVGFGGALSPKRIAQASKLACNPFAQSEVRMRELQRLLKDASPESIAGAVRRFGANAQGHIADEEEKAWLMNALVDLGDKARAPLQGYIRTEQKLTYSLMAFERIEGSSAVMPFFISVLQEIGPGDHQKVEPKQQLVAALIAHAHEPSVQEALAPFLADHSDDVVWAVLDAADSAINHLAEGKKAAALHPNLLQQLATLLTLPTASARISRRVAELLARFGAPLPGARGPLPGAIDEQYYLDGQGIVHARASA